MSQSTIIQTTEELGEALRTRRKTMGIPQAKAAPNAGIGIRFLRELEKGKPTVELGKVMSAIQGMGYDLAIVERSTKSIANNSEGYSKAIGTEYPYDWSNRQMESHTFIIKVLKAARFNDVLKAVSYFGFEQISSELPRLKDEVLINKIASMLSRIQKGKLLAQCQLQNASS